MALRDPVVELAKLSTTQEKLEALRLWPSSLPIIREDAEMPLGPVVGILRQFEDPGIRYEALQLCFKDYWGKRITEGERGVLVSEFPPPADHNIQFYRDYSINATLFLRHFVR